MGRIAEQHCDQVVLTDDNPRNENPRQIIEQIQAGMNHPQEAVIERDRSAAIASAIAMASKGDCVLIAGKGHETVQQLKGRTIPFSDPDCVQQLLAGVDQ